MQYVTATPYEDMEDLKELVAILNDRNGEEHEKTLYRQSDAIRLRRWVRAWQTMLEQNSGVTDIRKMDLTKEDRLQLEAYTSDIRVTFMPDGNLVVNDEHTPKIGWDRATLLFTRLLRNQFRDLLCGPCPGVTNGKTCGDWYIKKARRDSRFCSRRCAGNAAKAEERKRKHDGRITRTRKAIANYPTRPRRFRELDWKEYVVQAVSGVSRRFLTGAVNGGELVVPKGKTRDGDGNNGLGNRTTGRQVTR